MKRHSVAVLATATIALSGAVCAPPAKASPSGTVSITPRGVSHHRVDIRLLAGSATRGNLKVARYHY